jgi:cytoskeletal protein RodZ
MSLDAVSRATRLTRTVLTALESDRFEALPAPVYVRGFLRIYAQHLDLDPDALIEAYQQQARQDGEVPNTPAGPQLPEYLHTVERGGKAMSPAQMFVLVATALILGVFMWQVNRKRPVAIAARPTAVAAPATAAGPAVPPEVTITGRPPAGWQGWKPVPPERSGVSGARAANRGDR